MSDADFKKLYQYTVDYLRAKGVHNFLYVYSINAPVPDEASYVSRYPGDDYVDVLSFDQYDSYVTGPLVYKNDYFEALEANCKTLSKIAQKHKKLAAISETGIWVPKPDGSDHEGLLPSGNPMAGKDWYGHVGEIARAHGMPYYLVWVSTSVRETHIPYCTDGFRHEMADEFVNFYKQSYSIFAGDTDFYNREFSDQ